MIKMWVEKSREQVFKKYSRAIDKAIFSLPNGTEADFYIKAEGTAASVLAFTDDDKVITVKQYRPGPKKILNELPGGFVDPDEESWDAVKREFLEETGYAGDFKLVGTCLDDAYSTMVRYCFVATNCTKVQEPQQTATEHTEVELLDLAAFRQLLQSGEMTDVEVGYLGLDHLHKL